MVSSYDSYPSNGDVDTFDVQGAVAHLTDTVLKHKLVILLCCLFCLGLAWTYVKLFPPTYRAEVMVQAEVDDDKVREQFYSVWNVFRKSELGAEVELMTSSVVVRPVVEQLNLTYDDVYHSHLKHVLYMWEKSTIRKWYRKVKDWLSPPEESPFALTPEDIELGKAVKGFRDGAMLEPVPDSNVGYLVVKGPTYRVAEYANLLIDNYLTYRRGVYANEADMAYESLRKEVARAEQERDAIMEEMVRFEQAHGLAMGFTKDEAVLKNWALLTQMIQEYEFKQQNLEAGLQIINRQLTDESPTILKSNMEGRNPVHDDMRNSLFHLRKDLTAARLIYQPTSPEVRALERQIADLKSSLPSESEMVGSGIQTELSEHYEQLRARQHEIVADLASTQAELQRMQTTYEKVAARIDAIPDLNKQYTVLKRDQEIALVRVQTLQEKLVQADVSRVAARSAPLPIRVVDYASPPDKPSAPNTKLLVVVAVMFGLMGGTGLAFIIETLDNRATRRILLRRTDLPVYATIELAAHRSNRLRSQPSTLALERLKVSDS